MSDVRNWGAFIRGRWDWTRGGYEKNFPRGCQFTDVDAAVEFDGCGLVIEPKHYDGVGELSRQIPGGQRKFLENEARLGKTVFVLYGCGPCNDPYAIEYISDAPVAGQRFYDWRGCDKVTRRLRLRAHIERAMGLLAEQDERRAAA
jgi:hypothetical protein